MSHQYKWWSREEAPSSLIGLVRVNGHPRFPLYKYHVTPPSVITTVAARGGFLVALVPSPDYVALLPDSTSSPHWVL